MPLRLRRHSFNVIGKKFQPHLIRLLPNNPGANSNTADYDVHDADEINAFRQFESGTSLRDVPNEASQRRSGFPNIKLD